MTEHERQAEEFERIRALTRASAVSFLLTELQAGHTFLDTALSSRSEETRERTRGLARQALAEVSRRLADDPALLLDAEERAEIEALHERLAARLRDDG